MNILAVSCFFAMAWLLGITAIRLMKLKFEPVVKLAAAIIFGTIALAQIIYWQSWIVPFSQLSILVTFFTIAVGCVWWLKKNVKKLKLNLPKKFLKNWLIWLCGWALLWLLLWPRMLFKEADGLYAGWVNIWGDWAAHLTYATSFAFGDNFPTTMPILLGAKFSYPFLADFLPAILVKLGAGLIPAMIIPSIILSIIFVIILTGLGQAITKSFRAGKLIVLLFLFNGGFGWWWWIKDIQTNGLWPTLENLPQEYTHLEKLFNIEWINIITSQIIPQRGFLLGFPAAILVYLLLWQYWQSRQKNNLLAAGVITSLLPLVHAHSVAIIGAVGAILGLIDLINNKNKIEVIKNWLWFVGPILLIGLPQLLSFYGGSLTNGSFIHLLPGWLSIKRGDRVDWFWLKNLGLMAILPLIGLKITQKKLRLFSLPFWAIFIAANIWLFQPWEWDNTKFFVHWYLMACILAGAVLAKLPKITAAVLLFITILAGVLDVWRLAQYPYRKIRFWDNSQLQLSEWVKNNTSPGAIFLTADNHDHWLPTLTGRKILLGFKGWLWTYGLDYRQQERAFSSIFYGEPEAPAKIKELGLDYVVIGPMEKNITPEININWFRQNFPVVYQTDTTQVYSLTN